MGYQKIIAFDAMPITDRHKTGIPYFTLNLIDSMAESYADILFIGHYFGRATKATLKKRPNVVLRRTPFPVKLINFLRRLGIELPLELTCRAKPDLYIGTAFYSPPSLSKVPRSTVIYDLAYLDVPETVSERNRRDLSRFIPKSISRSTHLITNTEWTKKRIQEEYGTKKEIVVVPIPAKIPTSSKKTNHTLTNKPFILFLGTLEPRKNIENIILSYRLLPKVLRSKYSLILAGKIGWNSQSIESSINNARSEGLDLITPGYTTEEEREWLFSHAALFLFPSKYEGYGMPLMEAMANELPIVTSNIPVIKEVCKDVPIYCNPNSPKDIAKKVSSVLNNPKLSRSIAHKGYSYSKKITWSDVSGVVYHSITNAPISEK